MDSIFKLLQIALLVWILLSTISTARTLHLKSSKSEIALAARLKLDESHGSFNCWESLFQLQSCTSEIVLFFLNGETFLGPGCCEAVRIIQGDCWPNLLGSLGYTTEEGDVLEGYCDASEGGGSIVPTPPSSPSN
ncbi:hypothetical protein OROGR_010575 [Orobanche gracilis]